MMHNVWDQRPRSRLGDINPTILFAMIGASTSAWEAIELTLCDLFDSLLPSKGRIAHGTICCVESSAVRTRMILETATTSLRDNKLLLDEAKDILKLVSNFSARRNEIVHGIVVNMGEGGFLLCPNITRRGKWLKDDTNGNALTAKYQYNAEDILYYFTKFAEIIQRIYLLTDSINKLRDPDSQPTQRLFNDLSPFLAAVLKEWKK